MNLKNRPIAIAVACFVMLGGSPGLFAAQQPANWLGGTGNWTDATKWSAGVVPNNNATDTYNVNIDNGNPVSSNPLITGSFVPPTYTIDSLTIDNSDNLNVRDAIVQLDQSLSVNGTLTLVNHGAVRLPSDASINGTGAVLLNSSFSTLSNGGIAASGGTLTVEPTMTIRGGFGVVSSPGSFPALGSSGVVLRNLGRIRADDGRGLKISGSSIDNQGIIEVGRNAMLVIDSNFNLATFGNLVRDPSASVGVSKIQTNTGQTLNISQNWGWQLTGGGTITGGTITTTGFGSIVVGWLDSGTLDNVTLNGRCQVYGALNVTGTLAGNGTIEISEPETLESYGVIRIPTVPAGITIRGALDQSFDDPEKAKIFLTTNNGTIRAEKPAANGKLRLSGAVTNNGALEVTDTDTILAENGLTFGANGKLVIDGGGQLDVTGNLILSTTFDSLDIRPRLDGQPYASQLIATYSGLRSGTFNTVTPGISVQYLTGQIRISGTPVPEPAAAGLLIVVLGRLAYSRRGRLRG